MELRQISQLTTTCSDRAAAEHLVTAVIEKRLAACGQIDSDIRSVYHWNGAVANDAECRCTFKTSLAASNACGDFILASHAYETPELIVTTVLASAAYAAWVDANVASSVGRYRFDIRVHHLPAIAAEGPSIPGPGDGTAGCLPTITVPAGGQAEPMVVSFDAALEAIGQLPDCYVEPDGSILWTGRDSEGRWQVDGNLFDRGGRVVFATLSGSCPRAEFDRLLACFGWPAEPLMIELVRAAVFVTEEVFRCLAAGEAGLFPSPEGRKTGERA
jgi:periplasmic divalent cation tolerance protein